MTILTFSPPVMLALICCALVILVLVAFFPDRGENILRFCSGLVDLYQRLRHILQHTSRGTEVNTQQGEVQPQQSLPSRYADQTVVESDISDTLQGSSVPLVPKVSPQKQQQMPKTKGESY